MNQRENCRKVAKQCGVSRTNDKEPREVSRETGMKRSDLFDIRKVGGLQLSHCSNVNICVMMNRLACWIYWKGTIMVTLARMVTQSM
jgi:hypothetical protein